MKYAYVRTSSIDQCEDRQLNAMQDLGIPESCIFIDKQSGKNTARPSLQKLLSIVKPGDTVVVESVSRFARNTRDLLDLIDKLSTKKINFVSLKEHIDTTTPSGRFMLTVFAAMSELERDMIRQRQAEGIVAARIKGKHLGRPSKVMPDNFGELIIKWEHGNLSLDKILTKCGGVSPSTFYKHLSEYRIKQKYAEN